MTRNLKALGLALVAVFAMGALSASNASATDFFTTANGKPVLVTAVTHNSLFTMTGSGIKVECTTARFAAVLKNGATEAEIDTEYIGKINETPHGTAACTSSLGSLTLDTNGCQTKSTGATTGSDEGKTDATIWLECEVGKAVLITAPLGMTLSFPSQTPTSGGATSVNLANHPGGAAIEAKGTFTGMTYTCAPAFMCNLSGIPTHGDDVDMVGSATFTGYENLDGLPTPVTEGTRVGISVS